MYMQTLSASPLKDICSPEKSDVRRKLKASSSLFSPSVHSTRHCTPFADARCLIALALRRECEKASFPSFSFKSGAVTDTVTSSASAHKSAVSFTCSPVKPLKSSKKNTQFSKYPGFFAKKSHSLAMLSEGSLNRSFISASYAEKISDSSLAFTPVFPVLTRPSCSGVAPACFISSYVPRSSFTVEGRAECEAKTESESFTDSAAMLITAVLAALCACGFAAMPFSSSVSQTKRSRPVTPNASEPRSPSLKRISLSRLNADCSGTIRKTFFPFPAASVIPASIRCFFRARSVPVKNVSIYPSPFLLFLSKYSRPYSRADSKTQIYKNFRSYCALLPERSSKSELHFDNLALFL